VLLTGVPGFLGLFLLCSLLRRSDAIVHCLMRADSIEAGRRRLEESLTRLGLLDDYAAQRVVIVPGDLGKPLLGLAPATFEALAGSIDAIYHNGAWVNFLHNYQTLKATNVLGTQEIMRLAGIGRPLPIHYVSTMSVAPLGDIAHGEGDQELHAQWQDLSSGYVQSKWVAECILRIGAGRGLPVAVYRPTHLSGSSRDGAGNASDSWNLFVDACLELGEVPLGDMPINMIPVDDMSDYIVELSLRAGAIGRSYNLFHPRTSSMQALVDSMLAEVPSLARVPYGDWLAHCHVDPATRNLATIMPTELPEDSGNQHVEMPDNAVDMLIDDGHACPAIDASLLRKYVHWRLAARTQSPVG
jgi:thioester reductase-like protein